MTEASQRIAKFLAAAGIASRRAAESMIEQGRVRVNGETITTSVVFVGPQDQVMVDGQEIKHQKENPRFFLYHKPAGLVTTHKDPQGRPTVFQSLPRDLPRVVSVGRLDQNSEGLLLLTTHGGIVRVLEHPSAGLKRVYHVRVYGPCDLKNLESLRQGVEIDGVSYRGIEFKILNQSRANTWLELGLYEGKNREIRRLMAYCGLKVSRLIRTAYGPFELHQLAKGGIHEMPYPVVRQKLKKVLSQETWERLP